MNPMFSRYLLILLVGLSSCVAKDANQPATSPEKTTPVSANEIAGFSTERLQQITAMSRRYIDNQQYAGIVTKITRHGEPVHYSAVGHYGLDNDTPVAADTLFRIFSMTKPVTAVAAMILYEEGKFQLNDPVSKHLPEFAQQKLLKDGELVDPASPMTIRQLMTHTAGLTYGSTPDNPVDIQYGEAALFASRDLSEFSQKLSQLPLRFEPGTRYHYSVSSDLLGALIERLSGQTLEAFFEERIFLPLGMRDTFFSVPQEKRHRLASSHVWDTEKQKVMVVPAEQQRNYTNVTLFSGGGGLVSTIDDYLRFCQLFIQRGSVDGIRILGPKTINFMSSDHLTEEVRTEGVGQYPSADLYPGQTMALGMGLIFNPAITPAISTKGELSWSGAAGTKFWIDPVEGIVGVAMVQLYRSPWPLRFDLKVATYQALDRSASVPQP